MRPRATVFFRFTFCGRSFSAARFKTARLSRTGACIRCLGSRLARVGLGTSRAGMGDRHEVLWIWIFSVDRPARGCETFVRGIPVSASLKREPRSAQGAGEQRRTKSAKGFLPSPSPVTYTRGAVMGASSPCPPPQWLTGRLRMIWGSYSHQSTRLVTARHAAENPARSGRISVCVGTDIPPLVALSALLSDGMACSPQKAQWQ